MSCVVVMVVIAILYEWPPIQRCVIVDIIPAMYSIDSFTLLVSDATFYDYCMYLPVFAD